MTWHRRIWGIIEARAERSHIISKTYWSTDFFHIFFSGGMRPHKSQTGVTLAFSWGLNRAEAVPCATSTDAFSCAHTHVNTKVIQEPECPVVCLSFSNTQALTHAHDHASSCSLVSRHTAGVSWGVTELGWVAVLLDELQSDEQLFYCFL